MALLSDEEQPGLGDEEPMAVEDLDAYDGGSGLYDSSGLEDMTELIAEDLDAEHYDADQHDVVAEDLPEVNVGDLVAEDLLDVNDGSKPGPAGKSKKQTMRKMKIKKMKQTQRKRKPKKKPAGSDIPPSLPESFDTMAQRAGLTQQQSKMFSLLQLPVVLIMLLIAVQGQPKLLNISCIEFFAGVGNVAGAFQKEDLMSLAYDRFHDASGRPDDAQDLCSDRGFMTALTWLWSLKLGHLAWLGTVCSTWVLMSRGSTGRSPSAPLGNTLFESVANANMMVARSALLIALCYIKNVAWCLEQPSSSLMEMHPCMEFLKAVCNAFQGWDWIRVSTSMGAFGGPRPKASYLYGNRVWLKQLHRQLKGKSFPSAAEAGVVQTTRNGRMAGGKHLKRTQEYPEEFGRAVFDAWQGAEPAESQQVEERLILAVDTTQLGSGELPDPSWNLAGLEHMRSLL